MNHLNGMSVYLAGPIDRVEGDGVEWRRRITPKLENYGVHIFDPCNKPTALGGEIGDEKKKTHNLRATGQWEELRDMMQEIAAIDLRMLDKSDFIMAYVPHDVHMCGTWHEIAVACGQKKPCLLICPGGKENIPLWQFGVNHYDFFFSSFEEALDYLETVNSGTLKEVHKKRWRFFDKVAANG